MSLQEPETSPCPRRARPAALSGTVPVKRSDSRRSRRQETAGSTQLCWVLGTEPPLGCERHGLGLPDGPCASEPKLTGFEAKQMDFTGRRGRPPEEGGPKPTPNMCRAP